MTPEWQRAVRRYKQWFGSYRKSGELKKVPVWLTLNDGRIEFITQAASWKVKRARRNPSVICFIGDKEGPAIQGRAEISSDLEPIWRVYRAYWKTHPLLMAVLALPIKRSIKAGKHVLVRVLPDEPNPFAGVTDPEL